MVGIVAVGIGLWSYQRSRTVNMESITIGEFPYEASVLIYVAQSRDFFTQNGLKLIRRDYDSTQNALKAMLSGETDFSVTSEFNIVGDAFKKANISLIGSIDKFKTIYLIGRKDKGIVSISGLKGKRIGGAMISDRHANFILNLRGAKSSDVLELITLAQDKVFRRFGVRLEPEIRIIQNSD